MNWERDELLAKARLFAERGMEVERDSGLVPFWCTLSLELLARAALAHIHPVLLADPQQGENLLYAFGYPATNPRSIQTKTVLSRCQVVVERFTKAEEEFCASLLFLRNEELHTGTAAFENLPTSQWLVKFFYACQILLEHMGLDLSDLLPPDEVGPAQMMLNADAESVRSEVLEAIGRARSDFLALDSRGGWCGPDFHGLLSLPSYFVGAHASRRGHAPRVSAVNLTRRRSDWPGAGGHRSDRARLDAQVVLRGTFANVLGG